MDLLSKKILFVDLERKTSDVKAFPDFKKYIGGLALASKVYTQYKEYDPIILATGPLNGIFPFAAKTAIVFEHEGKIYDAYVGGHLSSRMRFADIDAIVLLKKSKTPLSLDIKNHEANIYREKDSMRKYGLPGKRSTLAVINNSLVVDYYFSTEDKNIAKKLSLKNFESITITGTETIQIPNMEKYEEVYTNLLKKTSKLSVENAFFPSCSGCPMGCAKSNKGEVGGNVLLHSLVACAYAENIYTDIGTVFSCLNCLGYDYTHEDIEIVPELVKNLLVK